MPIIYDEPATIYHANKALGSSDIRAFIRSPRLFRDQQEGLTAPTETAAMSFGTLAHLCLLEPVRFAETVIPKPEGMSFATKEGKAWRAENEGRLIVTPREATDLHYMRERLPSEIRRALASAKTEVTVRAPMNGLDCQCRVDVWEGPTVGGVVYDLKTIKAIEGVDRAIHHLSYHVQQQWYRRVIAAETGAKPPAFRFLFVETQAPYRWRIVQLDLDYIYLADEAIDQAISGIKARTASGCWDDPEDINIMASPPAWMDASDELTEDEE